MDRSLSEVSAYPLFNEASIMLTSQHSRTLKKRILFRARKFSMVRVFQSLISNKFGGGEQPILLFLNHLTLPKRGTATPASHLYQKVTVSYVISMCSFSLQAHNSHVSDIQQLFINICWMNLKNEQRRKNDTWNFSQKKQGLSTRMETLPF